MHEGPPQTAQRQPTTIERTSKPYKLVQLIGMLLIIASIFAAFGGSPKSAAEAFLVGAALFVFARLGAWWNNG